MCKVAPTPMTRHRQRGRPKYRLTIKLDLEWDADLIVWLDSFPRGQRSEMARQALRDATHPVSSVDLEAIRAVVADELPRALNGNPQPGMEPGSIRCWASCPANPPERGQGIVYRLRG